MRASFTSLLLVAALGACDTTRVPSALGERVRVTNGAFHAGELPGSPPLDDDAGAAPSDPAITDLEVPNPVVQFREAGKALNGRTTPDAYAVAMRFTDLGSGYWVVPVDGTDPTSNGERTWGMTADFGDAIPPGVHTLRFVAIDAQGHGGTQRDLQVCTLPAVPDNLNACDARIAPPTVVVSLAWDTNVDLDLQVVTPSGKRVDPRHPTTVDPVDGGISAQQLGSAGTGVIDRDSNAACVIDGIRREDLVWQGAPSELGTYAVYANLANACGLGAVHFTLSVLERAAGADAGTSELTEIAHASGALPATAANGGAALGLFLTNVTFQ